MSKHIIDANNNTVRVNGRSFTFDFDQGDWPLAGTYTSEDFESIVAKIHYDEDRANPRKDFDTFGEIITLGQIARDYNLVEHEMYDPDMVGGYPHAILSKECERCEGNGNRYFEATNPETKLWRNVVVTCSACKGTGETERTLEQYLREEHDAVIILGVSIQDYGSGMSAHVCSLDGDDSDRGAIFATKAKIKEEFGDEDIDAPLNDHTSRMWGDNPPTTRRECIERLLNGEAETLNQYLEGDVYGYDVTDPETKYDDSLWGMYGHDYTEQEVFERLADAIEARLIEEDERSYWAARDMVTV